MPGIRAELTFVGTATTVIRLGEFTVLTDPNFLHKGQRAYLGRGLWSRRLTEPAMGPGDLPELDAILLSHLHGDHFDRIAKRDLSHATPVITTPHAARRLRRYEFETLGLQPWATHKMRRADEELTISATPAVHARGVMGRLLPPVMGSLLEHRVNGVLRQRLHISGDTLTGPHVDEIAHRFDDIDTAVVHLGGTRILWHTVTMDGGGGADYLRRLHPATAVPVHYDDYRVFKSPLEDFLAAAGRLCPQVPVNVVRRGDTIALTRPG